MKKYFFVILSMIISLSAIAQTPKKISYQAVIRDASHKLVKERDVGVKTNILKQITIDSFYSFYCETHNVKTNKNGLLTIAIGVGDVVSGNMQDINWGQGKYFVKVETDPEGGSDYTIEGTSQLLAVPYALYAQDVANKDDADANPSNELQTLSFDNATGELKISDGNTVTIPAGSGGDNWGSQTVKSDNTLTGEGTSAKPLKVDMTKVKPTWSNIQGIPSGFADNKDDVNDADNDPNNEKQTLSFNNATGALTISNGNTVTIPAGSGGDNWGSQTVKSDNTLSGEGTSSKPLKVDITKVKPTWSNIQSIPSDFADNKDDVNDADHDPANEIQTLSLTGQTLTITNGNSVTLPTGGGGNPAGSTGNIQFNNNSSFGASSDLFWKDGDKSLGIGTNAPKAMLHVAKNGSNRGNVVFTGEVNPSSPGAPPVSGAGTRMMWYPGKAAFRAGNVDGTQWDAANIGFGSVAMGGNTEASGKASTAMGASTKASGDRSIAMGDDTEASGESSVAMGSSTEASGDYAFTMGNQTKASGLNSTAMGQETTASGEEATAIGDETTASGNNSTAMGLKTTASGSNSTAMGLKTTASGSNSTAMGWATTASGLSSTAMGVGTTASGFWSTAMGEKTTASGYWSTAMGWKTKASGEEATAMGKLTEASGENSTAMGEASIASGKNSIAMGDRTEATASTAIAIGSHTTASGEYGSIATGYQTTASGNAATAMGRGTTANAFAEVAVGSYNRVPSASASSWNATEPIFVVGNGTSASNRKNAITVLKNGKIGLGSVNYPTYTLQLPNSNSTGVAIAQSWSTFSDRRVKSNIKSIDYGLSEIMQMKPVSYFHHDSDIKDNAIKVLDSGKEDIGFIAQEVYKIVPEIVSKPQNDSTELWGMTYEKLVPVLVKAIQEQQKTIQEQKDKMEKQQEEMEEMQKQKEEMQKVIENLLKRVEKLEEE